MDLLQKILNCSEEDIDTIVQQAIEEANSNSDKVEKRGFLDHGKANNIFKGFIPLNTRIKYSNLVIEDYSMQTTYSKEGVVKAYYPFVGALSNEEFLEFANNETIKGFENYEFVENKRVTTTGERLYVVGDFEIDKKKNKTGSELG